MRLKDMNHESVDPSVSWSIHILVWGKIDGANTEEL